MTNLTQTQTLDEQIWDFLPLIRVMIKQYVNGEEDIKDLCQDVCLKLLKNGSLPALRHVRKKFIKTTAIRTAIDFLRMSRKEKSSTAMSPDDLTIQIEQIPCSKVADSDFVMAENLNELLMTIPRDQGIALSLLADGYSYGEIAIIQKSKVGTVRSRIFNARKRIRKLADDSL